MRAPHLLRRLRYYAQLTLDRLGLPPVMGGANQRIGLDEPTTKDFLIDTEELLVSGFTVQRERMQVAGATDVAIATVTNTTPGASDYALHVRTQQGHASGTPMFTDPTDRALRDMGKVDIAGFDVALPAGSNNIGAVNARVRNAADSGYVEPSTLGEQQTQTTALQLIDNLPHGMNAAFNNAAAMGGQLDDTSPTAATEDNVAPVRITAQRGVHVNLRNNAGTEIGTAGTPVRVDPTGTTAQPITDNAGSLTVDAPVGTPVNVQVGDGTRTATVRDTGTSDALNVAIVDASGNQITSFGGGTEYTEDAATPADPVGGATLLRRRDTPAAEVSAAADWVTANATNYGAQFVQVLTSSGAFVDTFGGSGGTAQADESSFTEGTTNMTPVGGVLNDTITSDPTEDQTAAVRITAKRAFHVNLRDVGGTEIGTSGAPVRVDPTGTTTQPVSGTVTANAGTGTFNVQVAAETANKIEVQGDVAHNAVVAGNPVTIGGVGETAADSAPSTRASADGNAVRMAVDRDGAVYVLPHGPQVWSYHENSSSALTAATVHAAPGSGLSLYVTDIVCSTGAATALNILFQESSTTVLGPYYLEAVAGRGIAIQFRTPKKITANTALTVTTSAAIAHGIDVTGYVAPG